MADPVTSAALSTKKQKGRARKEAAKPPPEPPTELPAENVPAVSVSEEAVAPSILTPVEAPAPQEPPEQLRDAWPPEAIVEHLSPSPPQREEAVALNDKDPPEEPMRVVRESDYIGLRDAASSLLLSTAALSVLGYGVLKFFF